MATTEREQYDDFAAQYDRIRDLPIWKLENDLMKAGLGNCKDARILDLGGGSGAHARTAIALGASSADVVDISQEMLNIGAIIEKQEGRHDKINFMLGDVTKPLDHLGLRKASYDIVMVNWVFDHSTCLEDLEAMWQNVAAYAKPGGRYIGLRSQNVKSPAMESGKYGIRYRNPEDIPDGLRYKVVFLIEPPLEFEGTSMFVSCSGSTEMHEKHGFKDVDATYGERTDLVKQDPDFWADMLADPWMAFVTAVKA